jgi:hypothetical protein
MLYSVHQGITFLSGIGVEMDVPLVRVAVDLLRNPLNRPN